MVARFVRDEEVRRFESAHPDRAMRPCEQGPWPDWRSVNVRSMVCGMLDDNQPIRRCSRCHAEKPLDHFHRSARQGHQWWCKGCHRLYDAAYHARTKPLRLQQKRVYKAGLLAWMRGIKASRPCADCGGRFHPAAMTFDHLPEHEKIDAIAELVKRGNRRLAHAEVLKCDVVCANCHAIRTYERREAAKAGRVKAS